MNGVYSTLPSVADNNGVCVKARKDSIDRYEIYCRLEEIIELKYPTKSIKSDRVQMPKV